MPCDCLVSLLSTPTHRQIRCHTLTAYTNNMVLIRFPFENVRASEKTTSSAGCAVHAIALCELRTALCVCIVYMHAGEYTYAADDTVNNKPNTTYTRLLSFDCVYVYAAAVHNTFATLPHAVDGLAVCGFRQPRCRSCRLSGACCIRWTHRISSIFEQEHRAAVRQTPPLERIGCDTA